MLTSPKTISCPTCSGEGVVEYCDICQNCDGEGCESCCGTGHTLPHKDTCHLCEGKGRIENDADYTGEEN